MSGLGRADPALKPPEKVPPRWSPERLGSQTARARLPGLPCSHSDVGRDRPDEIVPQAVVKAGSTAAYKSVGRTYDGVKVLAPKTKSKMFTAAEVRRAIQKALEEVSESGGKKPLGESGAMRIQQRPDGRFEVRRPGASGPVRSRTPRPRPSQERGNLTPAPRLSPNGSGRSKGPRGARGAKPE